MVKAMKQAIEIGAELDLEGRNLFSVAYKSVVGARRSSWRVVSSYEHRAETAENAEAKFKVAHEYRQKIEQELHDLCNELLVSYFKIHKNFKYVNWLILYNILSKNFLINVLFLRSNDVDLVSLGTIRITKYSGFRS